MNVKAVSQKEHIKIPSKHESDIQSVLKRYLATLDPTDKATIEAVINEAANRAKNGLSRYIADQIPPIVETLTVSKMNAEIDKIKERFMTEIKDTVFSMVITEERVWDITKEISAELMRILESNSTSITKTLTDSFQEQRKIDQENFETITKEICKEIENLKKVIAELSLNDIVSDLEYLVEDVDEITAIFTILNPDDYDSIEIEMGV